jgi:Uma2 family endonuclease
MSQHRFIQVAGISNSHGHKITMNNSVVKEIEETQEMGSLNHSIAQARLTSQLSLDDKFTLAVELSLDVSQIDLTPFGLTTKELKPDVCLYPKTIGYSKPRDIIKMPEVPLLTIEILSPTQSIDDILAKIQAYFAMGVKSVWLVMPAFESITVYISMTDFKLFDTKRDTEVIDKNLDIRLPLQKIFN